MDVIRLIGRAAKWICDFWKHRFPRPQDLRHQAAEVSIWEAKAHKLEAEAQQTLAEADKLRAEAQRTKAEARKLEAEARQAEARARREELAVAREEIVPPQETRRARNIDLCSRDREDIGRSDEDILTQHDRHCGNSTHNWILGRSEAVRKTIDAQGR